MSYSMDTLPKNEHELERYCIDWQKRKQAYNGWSNYATWRVNLELVDAGYLIQDNQWFDETVFDTVSDLAESIRGYCTEIVCNYGEDEESIAYNYALAFFEQVNWYEIAQHIAEDYPSLIKSCDND